jgi:PGF-CTERM protein
MRGATGPAALAVCVVVALSAVAPGALAASGPSDAAGTGDAFAVAAAAAQEGQAVGEVGRVRAGQPTPDAWHAVDLENTYANPVVLMKPVSFEGSHPVHVRLRNVESGGFEFKLEEWPDKDGSHTNETVSYLVLEAGAHTLGGGTSIEAGTRRVDEAFTNVTFTHDFASAPVVVSQSQTAVEGDAVVTRNRAIDAAGFETRLQEAESTDGDHRHEVVGYVAVEAGTTSVGTTTLGAGRTGDVSEYDESVAFPDGVGGEAPVFLADMQTTNGVDTAQLRYDSLDADGASVWVEEGESGDYETDHADETVGWLAFGESGTIRGGMGAGGLPEGGSLNVENNRINLLLKGERTTVEPGRPALLQFSAVNLVSNDRPMTIQLILEAPSGVSVTGASFVEQGVGQYSTVFDLDRAGTRGLRIEVEANEPGRFAVTGHAIYYFGDDRANATSRSVTIPITVTGESGTAGGDTDDGGPTGGTGSDGVPGFGVPAAVFALLGAAILRGRR